MKKTAPTAPTKKATSNDTTGHFLRRKTQTAKPSRDDPKSSAPKHQKTRQKKQNLVAKGTAKEVIEELRQWDLAIRYGPCIGMTRLFRWERAKLLGLNPPQRIRDLVEDEAVWEYLGAKELATRSLWYGTVLDDYLEVP